MREFVNRKDELAFLEKRYGEEAFQFIPLYGRRRIGKTRLVQEFIRDKQALYFMADAVSEREQLKNLGRETGDFFHDAILTEGGFKDWYQFFAYLKEKTGEQKLILVIDEFPYLVNANHAISSIFQKGIDSYFRDAPIFLILMGSSIGMMEKEVLYHKAPLYGRRTASLEVKDMPFAALTEFYPRSAFVDRVSLYGVTGAIPAYLELMKNPANLLGDIHDNILERGSFLFNEVEFLLREELREPRNYFVILRAIAQGKRKLGEIINDTGMEKAHLSRYLDILRGLRLVEKEIPVTEKTPDKSRRGLYRIHDRFFTFWFRYVFPFRGRLEIGQSDYVMGKISETFDVYCGDVYEDVCRELCRGFMKEGVLQFTDIGRWWSKNQEIDIVALDDEENVIYFGECKWSNKKVGVDIYENLVEKSKHVDWHAGKRKERFMLFSKSGFTPAMIHLAREKQVILVHGEDLVNLEEGGVKSLS
jgi:uncharacterized protein